MLRRLAPLVEVALAVGAGMAVLRLALSLVPLAWVPWPVGVPNDRTIIHTYTTERAPEEPWNLILGGSSAYFAFDPEGLGADARKMTFNRAYPTDLAISLSWLLRNGLPAEHYPERVVLTLNLVSFIDRGDMRPHPCVTSVSRGRPDPQLRKELGICDGVVQRLGALDRLAYLLMRVDPWLSARPVVKDAVVNALRGLVLPTPPPIQDIYQDYESGLDHDALGEWMDTVGARYGLFDADPVHSMHVRGLAAIDALCADHEIELVILSMPEPSPLRRRYDPLGRATFDVLLAAHGDVVLDWFDALPDDAFHDHAHVVEQGRELATARLAGWLSTQ